MARTRRLLVLAKLDPEQKRVLGVNATANDLELSVVESVEAALTWIDRSDPRVVVFDTSLPRADKLCAKVRSKKALAFVPIIGITSEINDALAPKFYGMGADDLVPPALGAPLMSRLRAMPRDESLRPPPERGKAVVADSDKNRGDVFGRVLSNAGYDVKYALDAVALRFYAQQSDLKLVIVNSELGDPKALVEQSRAAGAKAVWIVTAQRRDLEGLVRSLADVPAVRVMGLGVPPENVLFTSNEMLSAGARPQRTSERVLFGTPIAFRAAGADTDEIGFCYNVSLGGLYVRTLAPAPEDGVWIELRPARAKQRVRLEGRVAWRRSWEDANGATVPPGFGVEIIDGLGDSLTIWRESYFAIAEPEGKVKRPPPELPAPALPPLAVTLDDPLPPSLAVRESTLDEFFEEISEVGPAPARPSLPDPTPAPPAPTGLAPAAAPAAPVLAAHAPPTRRKRPMLLIGLIVTGAVLGGVAAAALAVFGRPSPAPAPSPTRSSAASLPPPPASVAPSAVALPSALPVESAAPQAPPPDEGKDGSELNWNQGYLVVETSGSFDVYATGFKLGPSNEKHLSRCGLRFVRLGEGDPPRWRSEGLTVDVKCQATTRVKIEPDPEP